MFCEWCQTERGIVNELPNDEGEAGRHVCDECMAPFVFLRHVEFLFGGCVLKVQPHRSMGMPPAAFVGG